MENTANMSQHHELELLLGNEGLDIYGNTLLDLFNDAFPSPDHASQHETHAVHDTDLDFSDLFDFQLATLNADVASLCSPNLNATALHPVASEDPLQPPITTSVGASNSAVLNAYSVGKHPRSSSPTTNAQPSSTQWPFEHYKIRMEPHSHVPYSNMLHNYARKKRSLEQDLIALSWDEPSQDLGITKRRKPSDEERASARRVRTQRACLRCYVQKLKCSEGRPCAQCQTVFNRAHGSKMLQWTACVSSKLSDLNIFALGVPLPDHRNIHPTNELDAPLNLDVNIASHLYTFGLQLISSSGLLSEFDCAYTEVMQHTYGHHAAEIHPFILEERTPLHMLIQFNVLLLGSSIVGHQLIGYIRFVQLLRAACAIVSFECLEREFERRTLGEMSRDRQLTLLIQAALLLDQVIAIDEGASAFATCFTKGKEYRGMHQHLVQFVSYYLTNLISRVFGNSSSLTRCIKGIENEGSLGERFWESLSFLVPNIPLSKPHRTRGFADRGTRSCASEVNLEDFYQKL